MIVEHGLISFLQKFDEQPFLVKLGGKNTRSERESRRLP